MKVVRFAVDNITRYGLFEDGGIREISGTLEDIFNKNHTLTGKLHDPAKTRLLSPVLPGKVLCLGLNYREHARELGYPVPDSPVLFMKPATAVIGPGENIVYPPQSIKVDYEAELGVVIGKRCYRPGQEEASRFILGYTCANDVTARDLQPKNGQWTYAKSFDTFAPLGPWIETAIDDPENLEVACYINGRQVQGGSTAEHVFNVDYLVHYISHCMTLLPGDVIMTGTPYGVGPLKPGDTVKVSISQIGDLENPVSK